MFLAFNYLLCVDDLPTWLLKVVNGIFCTLLLTCRFKDFRNPDFLTKMVTSFNIDKLGTNLHMSVWNPRAIPTEDTYEGLRKQMNEETERRARELQQQQQLNLGASAAGSAGAGVTAGGAVGSVAIAAARYVAIGI